MAARGSASTRTPQRENSTRIVGGYETPQRETFEVVKEIPENSKRDAKKGRTPTRESFKSRTGTRSRSVKGHMAVSFVDQDREDPPKPHPTPAGSETRSPTRETFATNEVTEDESLLPVAHYQEMEVTHSLDKSPRSTRRRGTPGGEESHSGSRASRPRDKSSLRDIERMADDSLKRRVKRRKCCNCCCTWNPCGPSVDYFKLEDVLPCLTHLNLKHNQLRSLLDLLVPRWRKDDQKIRSLACQRNTIRYAVMALTLSIPVLCFLSLHYDPDVQAIRILTYTTLAVGILLTLFTGLAICGFRSLDQKLQEKVLTMTKLKLLVLSFSQLQGDFKKYSRNGHHGEAYRDFINKFNHLDYEEDMGWMNIVIRQMHEASRRQRRSSGRYLSATGASDYYYVSTEMDTTVARSQYIGEEQDVSRNSMPPVPQINYSKWKPTAI